MPERMQVMKRNGRVWIAAESKNVIMLDAAQNGMLVVICTHDASDPQGPSVHLLETILKSGSSQRNLNLEH